MMKEHGRDMQRMVATIEHVLDMTTAPERKLHALMVAHGTTEELAACGKLQQVLGFRWTSLHPGLDARSLGVGAALKCWGATLADVRGGMIE